MTRVIKIPAAPATPDERLLETFKRTGNQDALAALYLRYSDLLYGTCLKYLGDADDAKDAVMSIYQELLRKLPEHDVEHFKSWVYVVAKNHCLMKLRHDKKHKTVRMEPQNMQSGDFSHLDSILEKEEKFKRLEHCLDTLSDEQKRTIELFYYQNKCYNRIAEETGLEWNKVRSLIQNGRRNLKNCMEENGK